MIVVSATKLSKYVYVRTYMLEGVRLVLLLLILEPTACYARKRRQRLVEEGAEDVDEGDTSTWSQHKRDEIQKATEAEAYARRQREKAGLAPLPLFPTHTTVCSGGRPCRPGEGNMKGYQMWFQPYEHREGFVQSRSRRMPHRPEPQNYAELVSEARRVQTDGLVIVTSGDWDYREIVLNWVMHVHRQHSNAVVIAMETELYAELRRRRIPVADNSANLNAWNSTCLQRHIQAVRMERHLAVAVQLRVEVERAAWSLLQHRPPAHLVAPKADLAPADPGSASRAALKLAPAPAAQTEDAALATRLIIAPWPPPGVARCGAGRAAHRRDGGLRARPAARAARRAGAPRRAAPAGRLAGVARTNHGYRRQRGVHARATPASTLASTTTASSVHPISTSGLLHCASSASRLLQVPARLEARGHREARRGRGLPPTRLRRPPTPGRSSLTAGVGRARWCGA